MRPGTMLAGLGCAYALIALAIFPRWTVDDAFITYRYAENFALRGELTWNVGEDPIEGYTGLALPVALAGAIRLGFPPDPVANAIGVASLFASAALLAAALWRLGAGGAAAGAAVLIYLTTPALYAHAFAGLETLLFAASALGCVVLFLRAAERPGPLREAAFAASLLWVSLVRPEGALLALLLAAAFGAGLARADRARLPGFAAWIGGLFLAPGAAYFLWRASHYGEWLPNTFYAKANHGPLFHPHTVQVFVSYLYACVALPVLGGALAEIHARARDRNRNRDRDLHGAPREEAEKENERKGCRSLPSAFHLPLLLALAAYCVLASAKYVTSALAMNYSYRFFIHAHPLVMLGLGLLLDRAFCARGGLAPGIAAVAVAAQLAANAALLPGEMADAANSKAISEDVHARAAEFINRSVPREEWMIAVEDAGRIPYTTRLRTVDFGKLNDEKLARGTMSLAEQVDYFYSFNAGVAVFTSHAWNQWAYPGKIFALIRADPRFARYKLAAKFRTPRRDVRMSWFEFVYLREDLLARLPPGPRGDGPAEE